MNIENCNAYELVKRQALEDIKSEGCILRHKKTGARIALISNQDDNKVFYVGFRTPSQDSTGVAHIVEHTVLCGSEKFPAKDPFVELAKGSLNTFLNAMTYPDKTIYPVASANDKDFQNLMHVYLDAVFYPNIYRREEIFRQEGWHYELESPDEPLTINGVVYNEMKGAFSSPEGVLERLTLNSLYPDTSYQYESGGDPEEIPNLTYQGFLDFHRRYYHPSNSYIYLYGDMDMEEKLNWLDQEYLGKFERLDIDSAIRRQKPFEKPVEVTQAYSLAGSESLEDNTYLSYNYSVDTILNEKLYIAFDILDYVLLGAPGAPLKQALLDAEIGKDVISSYDNSTYQPMFSIMVKNSNSEKKQEFLDIVERVLTEQAEKGLDKKSLLAGLNSFEFRVREADFGRFPKGLLYGIQCLDSWLYDDDKPFTHLQALRVLDWLKTQVDTGYFEQLIRTYLLENPHRSMVILKPEHGMNARVEKALGEKLAAYKAQLSQTEIEKLVEDTRNLKKYQEEPSTQEELACIPMLGREDLKREAEGLVNEEREVDGTKVIFHEVASNGIAYLDLLFDSSGVAEEDIPYLGILKAVLGFVDTEHYSYGELASEINLHTGGIFGGVAAYPHLDEDVFDAKFEVHAKVLYDKLPKAMELIGEILSGSKLTDERRIYEIIAQQKSRIQMAISSSGNNFSALRAMSYYSKSAKYTDLTGGIELYHTISWIEAHYDEKKQWLAAKLKELISLIFRLENLLVSFGGEPEGYETWKGTLAELKGKLWDTPVAKHEDKLACEKLNEGFLDASQVQYVSRAGNFRRAGFAYTGVLRVLRVILSYEYLWTNIRVKGGAYGCSAVFGRGGDGYFSSYRDPNLEKTNQVYEGIPEYLRAFDIEDRDMTKYVIGAISDLDTPLTPAVKTRRSMDAYLRGLTFEMIQKDRDEVLGTDQNSIRAMADLVEAVLREEAFCVIGNEEKLKEQADIFGEIKEL